MVEFTLKDKLIKFGGKCPTALAAIEAHPGNTRLLLTPDCDAHHAVLLVKTPLGLLEAALLDMDSLLRPSAVAPGEGTWTGASKPGLLPQGWWAVSGTIEELQELVAELERQPAERVYSVWLL